MEIVEVDEKDLKAAGAVLLPDGRRGLRIHGWEIESRNHSILTSLDLKQWEENLKTTHLPEMVFGESCLVLKHVKSGIKIHFNAFDALTGWKQEGLPPVEVPTAAKWKFRSKPFQQVIIDYDYTFTTPYCGSETIEIGTEDNSNNEESSSSKLTRSHSSLPASQKQRPKNKLIHSNSVGTLSNSMSCKSFSEEVKGFMDLGFILIGEEREVKRDCKIEDGNLG